MKLHNVRLHWSLLLVPLAAVVLAAGCLPTPTSPEIRVPSFAPAGRQPGGASQAGLGGLLAGVLPDSLAWVQLLLPQPTGSRTFHLVAASGGDFAFGRAHLHIPPNAVAGDADVTIVIPDSATVGCDLQIAPAGLDHFSAPVTLTLDCAGTTLSQALAPLTRLLGGPGVRPEGGVVDRSAIGVYWQGPAGWTQVGSDNDLKLFLLSARLQHFSHYRAGW